jgi:hypothetical protein
MTRRADSLAVEGGAERRHGVVDAVLDDMGPSR